MNGNASAEKKKVLIVEDHPLFRAMLVQLVDKELGMTVCGETDNIKDGLDIVVNMHPDVALVDITLQGSSGLELVKDIKARRLQTAVLVLSMHEESLYAERVLRAGAMGYISKLEPPSEVVKAIRKVMAGEIYVSNHLNSIILERMRGMGSGIRPTGMDALSDREIEVFQLIGRGADLHEIAESLNLGLATVQTYRARIREKLKLRSSAEVYQHAAVWVATRKV